MGLFREIKKFFCGPKAPVPNFDEMRAQQERERLLLLEQQKKLKEKLEALEKERLEQISLLKTIAERFKAETQTNFSNILDQDRALSLEMDQTLKRKAQEFETKQKKLQEIQDALSCFEKGDFEKIEALSQDKEVQALFPTRFSMLIDLAAKSGRKDWVKLLNAKKLQEENKKYTETLEAQMAMIANDSKILHEAREKHKTYQDPIVPVERKASIEMVSVPSTSVLEHKERKEKLELSKINNSGRERSLEERRVGLLAYELARSGKLKITPDTQVFNSDPDYEKLQVEQERVNRLFQQPLDVCSEQGDNLGGLVQKILAQFAEDYDFQDHPVLPLALTLSAIAVIETLKTIQKSENEIIAIVEASLVAGLAREFCRTDLMMQHSSSILERVASLITKLPWQSEIAMLLKVSQLPTEQRMEVLRKQSKLFEISNPKTIVESNVSKDYYHSDPNADFETMGIHPKLRFLTLHYLEITQSKVYLIGDLKILELAKAQTSIQDYKERQQLRHKDHLNEKIKGKCIFELYHNGGLEKILKESDEETRIRVFIKEYRQILNLFRNGKNFSEVSQNRHRYIQIAENVITQIFPEYPEPKKRVFDFFTLPVALAVSKIKILQIMEDNLSEKDMAKILKASLFTGYVKKVLSDEPYDYSIRSVWECVIGHGDSDCFSERAHQEVDNLLKLLLKPREQRALYIQNTKQSPEVLKQVNLIEAYLQVLKDKELEGTFDEKILKDVCKVYARYSDAWDSEYKAINDMTPTLSSEALRNKNIIEMAVFQMVMDDQFLSSEYSLEKEVCEYIKSLGINITTSDSRLSTYREEDLLRLYKKKLGCDVVAQGKDDPKFIFSHFKASPEDFLKKFGIVLSPEDARLNTLKQKMQSAHLELEYIRKAKQQDPSIKNSTFNQCCDKIHIAESIINQTLPQSLDRNVLCKAFALASIGVAQSFKEKGKSKPETAEESVLVRAIVSVAVARTFYYRRTQGLLGNGYDCGLNLTRGRDFLTLSEKHPYFNYYVPSLKGEDGILAYFIIELRFNLLDTFYLNNVLCFLEVSRKPFSEREKFVVDQFKKGVYYYNSSYSYSERQWIDLLEYCDLIAAYRRIAETSDYPQGDSRILQEAERMVKHLGVGRMMQVVPYQGNIPTGTKPWLQQEIALKEKGEWWCQVISAEAHRIQLHADHILQVYKDLGNTANKGIQSLVQAQPLRNIFLPVPNNSNDKQLCLSIPASETNNSALVPCLSNSLSIYQNSQFLVSVNDTNPVVRFNLSPGTHYLMMWKKDGSQFYAKAIHSTGNFLKTSLKNEYICGQKYPLEFEQAFSGRLTLNYASGGKETILFRDTPYIEFVPFVAGPLELTIQLENFADLRVTKQVRFIMPSFFEKVKNELQEPNWSTLEFSSEQQSDGVIFKWKGQNFVKVHHANMGISIWEKDEITAVPNPDLYADYLNNILALKKFFEGDNFQQRMTKALLSTHWLLSKDIMFGPLFLVGYYIYQCKADSLEKPYFDLLYKQIALYETIQKLKPHEAAQFIEAYVKEFPRYWSQIFKKINDSSHSKIEGFILLNLQVFLTVLKDESFYLNDKAILKMVQDLLALRHAAVHQQSRAELIGEFHSNPLLENWLTDIHERWGADKESFEKVESILAEVKQQEEEHFGAEQVRYFNAVSRTRSCYVGMANAMVENFLDQVAELQKNYTALEESYANNSEQINQGLKQIQTELDAHHFRLQQINNMEHDYSCRKRQARKKQEKMMVKSLVSIAATAFFAPVLTQTIFAELGKLGLSLGKLMTEFAMAIGEGAFAGGINAGIMGENVTKSVLQGAVSGGIRKWTGGLANFDSKTLNEMVKAGSAALVDTGLNGGNIIEKVGLATAIAGVGHYLVPEPQATSNIFYGRDGKEIRIFSQVPHIFNGREIGMAVQRAMGRSFIGSTINAVYYKKPLLEPLFVNGVGAALQTTGSILAQNRFEHKKSDVADDSRRNSSRQGQQPNVLEPSRKLNLSQSNASSKHNNHEKESSHTLPKGMVRFRIEQSSKNYNRARLAHSTKDNKHNVMREKILAQEIQKLLPGGYVSDEKLLIKIAAKQLSIHNQKESIELGDYLYKNDLAFRIYVTQRLNKAQAGNKPSYQRVVLPMVIPAYALGAMALAWMGCAAYQNSLRYHYNSSAREPSPEDILKENGVIVSPLPENADTLLMFNKGNKQKGKNSNTNEPEAQKQREINKKKGIPESVLGPSGKPKIDNIFHPTKKRAKDASDNNCPKGKSSEHHSNPVSNEFPHFHPTGKKSREHHNYPRGGYPKKGEK